MSSLRLSFHGKPASQADLSYLSALPVSLWLLTVSLQITLTFQLACRILPERLSPGFSKSPADHMDFFVHLFALQEGKADFAPPASSWEGLSIHQTAGQSALQSNAQVACKSLQTAICCQPVVSSDLEQDLPVSHATTAYCQPSNQTLSPDPACASQEPMTLVMMITPSPRAASLLHRNQPLAVTSLVNKNAPL